MDKSSLTFQAFRNSTYNVVGYLWPVILTLVVTPIIVFTLGVKEYGVYIFINTTIALFGLLDLGLGTAVTKHLSYYYGKKDLDAVRRLVRSANSLFLIVSTLGLATAASIALWGADVLPSKFAAYEQYLPLFLIGGGIFFFNTVSSTASATLVATQRFDIYNKINMVSVTLTSLSTLFVVTSGGSIRAVFLTQLVITSLLAYTMFHYARKILPVPLLGLRWDKKEIKNCYTFGLVNFVNNIATSALASLDRMIIPLFIGPSNLTYYSMPGNIATKIPGMSNTLSTSLFPTVSQLSGSNDSARIETLYVRSFRLITVIAGALTIASISFSHEILYHWLDADFAERSSGVLIVLALTNFFLALFNPLSNFLLGLGKLRFLTLSSISMAVINILLLLILLPRYGILGAAFAYLISVLPVIYFFYHVERHYLNLSGRKAYYARTLFGLATTGILIWSINLGLKHLVVNLPSLLLVGGASTVIYVILYKLLGFFHPDDWKDFERFSSLVFKKVGISMHR